MYLEKVGAKRPLAGFAHPLAFGVWPASSLLRGLGAVPSTYAAAETTLAKQVPLLVFPGGDHETMRPIWQANIVDFGGRRGFLKLARKAGVPIVPMGIRGSHYTAPILFRSRVLAYLLLTRFTLGAKRWAISLLGVLGALAIVLAVPTAWPWRVLFACAWLASPLSYAPWIPATIRMRIGKPIAASELFAGDATDAQLDAALARVQGEVQVLVDAQRAPSR